MVQSIREVGFGRCAQGRCSPWLVWPRSWPRSSPASGGSSYSTRPLPFALSGSDPQLLRAARLAHVEQPSSDPRRIEEQDAARGAEQAALPGRQVVGEQPALRGRRQVVDDDVLGEGRPAELPRGPRAGDDGRARGIGQREGADLLGAVGEPDAVGEPAVRDRELLDAGDGLLQARRERGAVGDGDGVARAPGDVCATEGRIGARELRLHPVPEQEPADARLLPDDVGCRRRSGPRRARRPGSRPARLPPRGRARASPAARTRSARRPCGRSASAPVSPRATSTSTGSARPAAKPRPTTIATPGRRRGRRSAAAAPSPRRPGRTWSRRSRAGRRRGRARAAAASTGATARAPGRRTCGRTRSAARRSPTPPRRRAAAAATRPRPGRRAPRRARRARRTARPRRARAPALKARARERSSSRLARGTHGADHREASGRPGAGEPDEQRRSARARRSALDLRVVVHDAEDLAAAVAVARQRGVAVDAVVDVAAAVDEPADVAAAAAVPGAVDLGVEAVRSRRALADPGAGRRRERVPVRVAQEPAVGVDRAAGLSIGRPRSSTGWPSAARSGKPLRVDPRQAGRVRAGAGRVDVAAEVVGLRLLGLERGRDERRRRRPRAGAARPARGTRAGSCAPATASLNTPAARSAAASTLSSW